MEQAAGQLGQADVAGDQDGFGGGGDGGEAETGRLLALGGGATGGEGGVFRMLNDAGAEAAGIREGEPHEAARRRWRAGRR